MTRPGPRLALLLLGGYRRLVEAAVEELERQGYGEVRPSHHYAMAAVAGGATSASELGRRLAVTKQAALKTVTLLEDRGWVVREPDPQDGRRMLLRLSALGQEVMTAGETVFDELRAAWERELGAGALATLEEQLTRLVGDDPVRADAPGWVAGDQG